LHKQWSLSVEIKPTGTVSEWGSILLVGIDGDHATYGDRTPGRVANFIPLKNIIKQ